MNRQITLTVLLAAIVLAGIVAFLVFGSGTDDDGEVTATAGAEQAAPEQAPAATGSNEQTETDATEASEPPAEPEPTEAVEAPESAATESAEQAATEEPAESEPAPAATDDAAAAESAEAPPAEAVTEAPATAEAPASEPAPAEPDVSQAVSEATQPAPAEASASQQSGQPAEQLATLPPAEDAPEIALPPSAPPSFDVVRVEPNGDAVIAGRAEPGSLVVLEADGEPLAEARADSAGDWIMILDWGLGAGSHQLSLQATDSRGETLRSPNVVVVALPEPAPAALAEAPGPEAETPEQAAAGEAPAEETSAVSGAAGSGQALAVVMPEQGGGASTVLQSPESAGIADQELVLVAIEYDPDGQVIISGRTRPGARVLLYIDNLPIGEATAGADGQWSLAPTAEVAPGLHRLRIDQLDDGGQVVARVETPFSRADALIDLPADRFVVVQPGNSLWRIARRSYGEGVRYSVIYESNQSQIRDPDLIYPGQIFVVPEVN